MMLGFGVILVGWRRAIEPIPGLTKVAQTTTVATVRRTERGERTWSRVSTMYSRTAGWEVSSGRLSIVENYWRRREVSEILIIQMMSWPNWDTPKDVIRLFCALGAPHSGLIKTMMTTSTLNLSPLLVSSTSFVSVHLFPTYSALNAFSRLSHFKYCDADNCWISLQTRPQRSLYQETQILHTYNIVFAFTKRYIDNFTTRRLSSCWLILST